MLRRTFGFLLLLTATVGLQTSSAADVPGRWTRIGPDGGRVSVFAAAPSRPATVYAAVSGSSVFRSPDGGVSWTFAGRGLGTRPIVNGLAVDAAQPDRVYASTAHVLFRSANGGTTWVPVDLGTDNTISALAADPRRSGVVYVALGTDIQKSTDRGLTWKPLSSVPDFVETLTIDPVNPTTLYAGTDAGAYKSTDGGAHWKTIRRGIESVTQITAIAVDPHRPQTLFLSTFGDAPYRSVDGGGHWTRVAAGLGTEPDIRSLAVDPARSSTVYAGSPQEGVFRSTDSGLTWHPADAGLTDRSVQVLLAAGSGLFAGTRSGFAVSRNRAQTWTADHGIQGASIVSLALDSQRPPRMYASDGAHLFKSANRGGLWARLPLPPPSENDFFAPVGPVVIHPDDPRHIELGFAGEVGQSDDGGQSWSPHFSVGCVSPSLIVIDPGDPEILYTSGGFVDAGCGTVPSTCGSYKFDHGQTTCLPNTASTQHGAAVLAIDPADSHHLFAGGEKLYHSLDAGATWSVLSAAIRPIGLVFDPVNPGTLYARLNPGGVARSTDGGITWQVTAAQGFVLSLVIDTTLPSTLYAATPQTIYRSTDSGATWTPLGTGLEEVVVTQIALDPLDPRILYAATLAGGVMRLRM